MEVEKYYSYRYGGKKRRAKNWKATSEQGRKANSKRSRRWLALLIMANFVRGDWRIDLTYEGREPTPAEAIKRIRAFIRKLRRLYARKGKELKYIYTTEHKGHRVHHHLIINNEGITREDIEHCWKWSRIRYNSMRLYDGQPEDAQNVAYYITKETNETIHEKGSVQKWRWVSSKNLEKPEVKTEIVKARSWKEKPVTLRGYEVIGHWRGWTGEGYPCQRIQYQRSGDFQNRGSGRIGAYGVIEEGATCRRPLILAIEKGQQTTGRTVIY